MLDSYKKAGIEKQHQDLFDILNNLDKIVAAFDKLALTPDKITKEIMQASLASLASLPVLPKNQDSIIEQVSQYGKREKEYWAFTPDVVICMSKLCWYIGRSVRMAALASTGIVTNKNDIQTLQTTQD